MKWCFVTDCFFVICYMCQYLVNKYRIKVGGYLESLFKVVRNYQGRYEVDDLLNIKLKKELERFVLIVVFMVNFENESEVSGR